jgi:predicted DNA-binding transcriptional regulator YafY
VIPVSERVWEVMQRHVGRESGITCRQLAEAAQAPEREIRRAVTELREAGVPVCGHPKTGYYQPANPAELEEGCRFLRQRALTSLHLEAKLRGTNMAELLGQLRLQFPPPKQEELPLNGG